MARSYVGQRRECSLLAALILSACGFIARRQDEWPSIAQKSHGGALGTRSIAQKSQDPVSAGT
jgi:hypothetical protein